MTDFQGEGGAIHPWARLVPGAPEETLAPVMGFFAAVAEDPHAVRTAMLDTDGRLLSVSRLVGVNALANGEEGAGTATPDTVLANLLHSHGDLWLQFDYRTLRDTTVAEDAAPERSVEVSRMLTLFAYLNRVIKHGLSQPTPPDSIAPQ